VNKNFVLVTETFFRHFDPEDEDSKILRNVGNLAPTYTASHPTKLLSTYITTAVTRSNLADKMGFNCKQAEIVMSPGGKNVNKELLLLLLLLLFLLWRCEPARFMASSFLRVLDHTKRRSTVGRTPLDE
jgi:hypothetical protein